MQTRIQRPNLTKGRVNYRDNFEDILFRHRSLATAPNPEAPEMEAVKSLVHSHAWHAFARWRPIFTSMGLEFEDVVSIGMVHCIPWLHEHRLAGNEGLLVVALRQRFAEVAKVVGRKSASCSCLPNPENEAVTITDLEYENMGFKLMTSKGEHSLELRATGTLVPTLYKDGVKMSAADVEALRNAYTRGEVQIQAQDLEEVVGAQDLVHQLIYVALNTAYEAKVRQAAKSLCRRLRIKYLGYRSRFQELQTMAAAKGWDQRLKTLESNPS